MVAAGDPISAADVNINAGLAQLGADSATWGTGTTESASLFSATANVVNGKQYWISLYTHVSTTVQTFPITAANLEIGIIRVREASASGTQMMAIQNPVLLTSTVGTFFYGTAKYTATSTGAVQFHVTGQKLQTGSTGSMQIRAGGGRISVLRIDKIT